MRSPTTGNAVHWKTTSNGDISTALHSNSVWVLDNINRPLRSTTTRSLLSFTWTVAATGAVVRNAGIFGESIFLYGLNNRRARLTKSFLYDQTQRDYAVATAKSDCGSYVEIVGEHCPFLDEAESRLGLGAHQPIHRFPRALEIDLVD